MIDPNEPFAPARERLAAWSAAIAGEITTEQLYDRLRELRRECGNAVYDRPVRSR